MKKYFIFAVAALALSLTACGDKNEPSNGDDSTIQVPIGAINGQFSVSANKKVFFSKGNLQYVGLWFFATNQWDYFGESQSDNHRDFFGWGTGTTPNKVIEDDKIENLNSAYAVYTEWGDNPIINGGNKEKQWRTLTKDEWKYLFFDRKNAAKLFGMGTVNGVNGTIILPDNWTGSKFTDTENGLTYDGEDENHDERYINVNDNNYSFHSYSKELWENFMEPAGAVFLPAAGMRNDDGMLWYGLAGRYWSYTDGDVFEAFCLYFDRCYLKKSICSRCVGLSVRLVQDVK